MPSIHAIAPESKVHNKIVNRLNLLLKESEMTMLDIKEEEELLRKIETEEDWLDSPECLVLEEIVLDDEDILESYEDDEDDY